MDTAISSSEHLPNIPLPTYHNHHRNNNDCHGNTIIPPQKEGENAFRWPQQPANNHSTVFNPAQPQSVTLLTNQHHFQPTPTTISDYGRFNQHHNQLHHKVGGYLKHMTGPGTHNVVRFPYNQTAEEPKVSVTQPSLYPVLKTTTPAKQTDVGDESPRSTTEVKDTEKLIGLNNHSDNTFQPENTSQIGEHHPIPPTASSANTPPTYPKQHSCTPLLTTATTSFKTDNSIVPSVDTLTSPSQRPVYSQSTEYGEGNNSQDDNEQLTKLQVQTMMQQTKIRSPSKHTIHEDTNSPTTSKAEKQEPGLKTAKDQCSTQDNDLPSYTAMIAQAILKKESSKSTLSDIYEYMEKYFPTLAKRGTGWRNCVRHTLSLNDCFIKLHRPENGRSCNWAVHPTYYESFSKGDYRKRRALRKRPRGLQWIDPAMLSGYQFGRNHHEIYGGEFRHHHQQQPVSPFYHYPSSQHHHPPQTYYQNQHHSPPGNFNNQNFAVASSTTSPHFQNQQQHHQQQSHPQQQQHQQPQPQQQHQQPQQNVISNVHLPSYPHQVYTHTNQHLQHHVPHCTNSDCYCQYSKQTYSRVYTP